MRHPAAAARRCPRAVPRRNSVAMLYDGVRQFGGVGQTFIYDPGRSSASKCCAAPASVLWRGRHRRVVNVIPKPTRGPSKTKSRPPSLPARSAWDSAAARSTTNGRTGSTSAATTAIPASTLGFARPGRHRGAAPGRIARAELHLTQAYALAGTDALSSTPLVDGDVDYGPARLLRQPTARSSIATAAPNSRPNGRQTPPRACATASTTSAATATTATAENYAWQPASGLIQRGAYRHPP